MVPSKDKFGLMTFPVPFASPATENRYRPRMGRYFHRREGLGKRHNPPRVAQDYAKVFGRVLTVPGSTDPVPPVTMDIVRTVLRANDYAPLFRDTLAAISYNTLRLVDIRRLVQVALKDEGFATQAIGWKNGFDVSGIRDYLGLTETNANGTYKIDDLTVFVQAWAREQYLDRGQTPESAKSLAVLAIQAGRTTNQAQATASNPAGRRRWMRLLEKAFRVGLISADNFRALTGANFLRRPRPQVLPVGFEEFIEADDDVFADVFAEDDMLADQNAAFDLASEDDLLTSEEFTEDFVSEEFSNV